MQETFVNIHINYNFFFLPSQKNALLLKKIKFYVILFLIRNFNKKAKMENKRIEIINENAIIKELSRLGLRECAILDTVDSTNTESKRRVLDGADTPLLVLADSQTAGRGRMGRSFYSPSRTGLYMSLALELTGGLPQTVGITSAAAVAAVRAIHRVYGIETGIKWVNDVYLNGKKIAGILSESFFANEKLFVIIGIGINLSTDDFPHDIADIAGSLDTDPSLKSTLAAEICKELLILIPSLKNKEFMKDYRKYSVVLGKKVIFQENGVFYRGTAESISDSGALTVLLDNGERRALASGEISLRVKE